MEMGSRHQLQVARGGERVALLAIDPVHRVVGLRHALEREQERADLRALLRLTCGFHVGLAGMLEIGQLENLNYWVESRDHTGRVLWAKDELPLEEAIGHFLRIRRERELGFDIETDLNPGAGHIGPR